jgi:transcriptional regulator with PAS, ATPase and Fis domain
VETVAFGELAPGLFGGRSLAPAIALTKAGAPTDIPMVIVGETGTGKELFARAVHQFSGRRGRFHALNCSALPPTLAEAELFGHERGAFSGADRARPGHLKIADGGTLFLDEIADLPLSIQAKLLRALEQGEATPLGSAQPVPFHVRIVAATHEPLEHYVKRGTFRADLLFRLAGFRIEVPPLRNRREDIAGLFFHMLKKHAQRERLGVEIELLERMCLYDWPGNVRELELFTRKLLALRANECTLRREFADGILPDAPAPAAIAHVTGRSDRREHDLSRLNAALVTHENNLTAAAATVGISRRRAYRLLAFSKNGFGEEPGRISGADGDD